MPCLLYFFLTLLGSGLVVSVLDSRLEGCGLESRPTLDGNGVKAMPGAGSIPVPNFGSFNNQKSVPNGAHQVLKNSALDHAENT